MGRPGTVYLDHVQLIGQPIPSVDANTNRFQTGQGYQYDFDGNLIQDVNGKQFTFDGDNKQVEIRNSASALIGKYFYDGNGKRVKKLTATETVIFVYDALGKLVAEYSTANPVQAPTVNYTATDPLGSPRVITNKLGEIVSRRDFMPFGEQLAPDTTYRKSALKYNYADNVRQKFTGYQRDEESGLDFAEARYYNNNHGRFTAVDPLLASGKSANPQTFNRYAYTMNRPLIYEDSTGLQVGQNNELRPATGGCDVSGHYDAKTNTLTPNSEIARVDAGDTRDIFYKNFNLPGLPFGPDPISDPVAYEMREVEKGINEIGRQTGEFLYRYSPDYCKVQCSMPVLGGLELTGSKDLRIFFGGGKTIGSGADFKNFLEWADGFGKNGSFSLKIGCTASCGFFVNRDLSPDARSNAIAGSSLSATIPLGFAPVTITGNQSFPLFSGERSVEAGYGVSGGISVSQSEEVFDFKKWMETQRNTAGTRFR